MKTKKALIRAAWLVYGLGFALLALSVIKSAIGYQFDHDELYHVQQVYLGLAQGLHPYSGFYSVYSPFLLWLLTPLYTIVGFSLHNVTYARMVMVGLFALRLGLAFWLVKKVFGRIVAALFALFFLLDPFTVFVSMQIRPENLMMVVYQLFLLVLCFALLHKSKKTIFAAGFLAGFTLLVSIKIIPAFFAIVGGLLYFRFQKKQISEGFNFMNGFILSVGLFFLYYFLKGDLILMFQQLFIDPFLLNGAIKNPTTLNYFYFSNPTIYGFEGKPAAWYYAILLPATAWSGMYAATARNADKKDEHSEIKILLILSFVGQWLSMPFINSVWIQYYIPLLWFYALFTAVLVSDIYMRLQSHQIIRHLYVCVVILFLAILVKSSIVGNTNRSHIGADYWQNRLGPQWAQIKPDDDVFPNILFRPLVYKIPYGGTYSPFIMSRYEPVEGILEKKQVPYLILEGDVYETLNPSTQQYINTHYKNGPQLPALYTRMKK